jgi:hypothetical protein
MSDFSVTWSLLTVANLDAAYSRAERITTTTSSEWTAQVVEHTRRLEVGDPAGESQLHKRRGCDSERLLLDS